MRAIVRSLCIAAVVMACGAAQAKSKDEAGTFGIAVDGSVLLGLGVSVAMPVGERFNLRAAYHSFTYDLDDIEDDSGATYSGELDLGSAGIMADWFPFKGAFRLTVGYMANDNAINLSGRPTGGVFTVGDCTFESNPADPMRVDGTVEFAGSAPYVGIGWGGNMHAEPGFFATLDVGVVLSGSPETGLTGRGQARNANAGQPQCGDAVAYQDVSTYPEFQQEVQDAQDEVDRETKDFEYWPNIAIGLGWRF